MCRNPGRIPPQLKVVVGGGICLCRMGKSHRPNEENPFEVVYGEEKRTCKKKTGMSEPE